MSRTTHLFVTSAAVLLSLSSLAGCTTTVKETTPYGRDSIDALEALTDDGWSAVDPAEMRQLYSEWGPTTDPATCQALTLQGNGPVLGEEVEQFDDYARRGGPIAEGMRWTTARLFESPERAAAFIESMSAAFAECTRWKRGDGLLFLSESSSITVVDGWTIITRQDDAAVSVEDFDAGVLSDPLIQYYLVRENVLVGGEMELGYDPAALIPLLNEVLS